MQYSDRAMAITPFYAMAFGEKATALEQAGHNVIRLNIGEPDFGALSSLVWAPAWEPISSWPITPASRESEKVLLVYLCAI